MSGKSSIFALNVPSENPAIGLLLPFERGRAFAKGEDLQRW
jgi:hypothetical protein